MIKYLISFILPVLLFTGCRNLVDSEPLPDTSYQNIDGPILIKAPYEGVTWEMGTSHRIEWENFKATKLSIILTRKKKYNIVNIAEDVKNTGYYDWTIPQNINGSHHYQIKLISSENPNYFTYSSVFNILKTNN